MARHRGKNGRKAGDLVGLLQMAVYRLVQEAFTNVVKHAGASTCRLQVDMLEGS